jgi:hypothetical protein
MYFGAWVKSAKGSSGQEFHVGPHLMVVSPHQDDFQGFNRDGSNGMPCVAHLPGHTELYLMMIAPVLELDGHAATITLIVHLRKSETRGDREADYMR